MMQENRSGRQAEIHITQMRRNPYLVDYQTGKNTGRHIGRRIEQRHHSAVPQQENRIRQQKQKTAAAVSDGNVCRDNTYNTRTRQRLTRAERQRRRRRARIRRYIRMTLLCAGILVGIVALTKLLKVPASTAEASTPMEAIDMAQQVGKGTENTMGTRIQGLSAETYAAHPDWTEDFLTVNEYSRPGDPLTEVNNIFVHYTANPGTSAAQNRSLRTIMSAVPARISSSAITGRSSSVFLWMRSLTRCRPVTRIPSLSNAAIRRTTDSSLRRPTIP